MRRTPGVRGWLVRECRTSQHCQHGQDPHQQDAPHPGSLSCLATACRTSLLPHRWGKLGLSALPSSQHEVCSGHLGVTRQQPLRELLLPENQADLFCRDGGPSASCLSNPPKGGTVQLVQGAEGEPGPLTASHSVLSRPLVSYLGMNRCVGLGPPRLQAHLSLGVTPGSRSFTTHKAVHFSPVPRCRRAGERTSPGDKGAQGTPVHGQLGAKGPQAGLGEYTVRGFPAVAEEDSPGELLWRRWRQTVWSKRGAGLGLGLVQPMSLGRIPTHLWVPIFTVSVPWIRNSVTVHNSCHTALRSFLLGLWASGDLGALFARQLAAARVLEIQRS